MSLLSYDIFMQVNNNDILLLYDKIYKGLYLIVLLYLSYTENNGTDLFP